MRETGMVIECESRKHKFLLGLTDDGYRDCPICSERLRGPREAFSANEIYGMKTIGQAWREKRKAESNKPKQTIQIDIEMNTDKMQLKLRTIAKHAEALANELDAIDNAEPCVNCGSINRTKSKLFTDNNEDEPLCCVEECDDCGHTVELPTRFEGSE